MKSEILRRFACSLIIVFGAMTFTNVAQSNEAYGNLFERKKSVSPLPARRAAYIPRKAAKRVKHVRRAGKVVRNKRVYKKRIYKKRVYKRRAYKKRAVVRKKRFAQKRYVKKRYIKKRVTYKRKSRVRRTAYSPQKRVLKRKSVTSRVSGRSRYSHLIAKHASTYGVPVKLAHAVVKIESNYRAGVRGGAGEIGLMQIKPATARLMGFRGSSRALYNPDTNLKYGMKYLAGAYKRAGGNVCGTVLRYNAGHGARRMNPISARYCRKAKRILRTNKLPARSQVSSDIAFENL